jgi:hypothetical protein
LLYGRRINVESAVTAASTVHVSKRGRHVETVEKDSITVIAGSRSEAFQEIDWSVEQLQRRALQERTRGILVTRRGWGHFTIELSNSVPYGMTLESTLEAFSRR